MPPDTNGRSNRLTVAAQRARHSEIVRALMRFSGNVQRTARFLGIHASANLYREMSRRGIKPDNFRPSR